MAEPNDRYERLISREKELWRGLNNCIEQLKHLMQRVKTEEVKEGVEQTSTVYNKLTKQRIDLHAEFKAQLNAAGEEVQSVSNKVADRIAASESRMMEALDGVAAKLAEQCDAFDQVRRKLADQEATLFTLVTPPDSTRGPDPDRGEAFEVNVMGVLGQVSEKLTEQDVVLSKLTRPVAHAQSDEPKWTEVERRHKGKVTARRGENSAVDVATEKRSGPGNANRSTKTPRARPLAIMVTKGEEGFPELLKTVRRTVDPAVTGDAIAKDA